MPIKNKEKRAAYNKQWAQENKEKRKAIYKKYRDSNKEELRSRNIYQKYSITGEEYDKLFIEAPLCEICKVNKSSHLDHNHKTGKIRGVLCQTCNTGLGKLGDTIEGLEAALQYLKERE